MKKLVLITVLCLFTLQCEQGWIKNILVPPVEGCTDSSSCNYNADAEDDDSCWFPSEGCECSNGEEAVVDNCGTCDNDISNDCTQDCMDTWGGDVFDSDNNGICDGLQGSVADIDGNIYNTVKIGNQEWMAANLKSTHYQNGEEIPEVTDASLWVSNTDGAYCNYDNDYTNVEIHGRLYNGYAAMNNICPIGWNLPSDEEWQELEVYLGMHPDAAGMNGWERGENENIAGMLKEAGDEHWLSPNVGANNSSGFTAIPGGWRMNDDGEFKNLNVDNNLWTSTESENNSSKAYFRTLGYDGKGVYRSYFSKNMGFSVRCFKTTQPTVNIIFPLADTEISGTVIIKVSIVNIEDISIVVFFRDNVIIYSDTEFPFEYEWDTTNVDNGNYTIQVKAYDTSDNLTISQPIILTVQN